MYAVFLLLDSSWGVAENRGSETLSDSHQTGPVHLHNQIIHQDPGGGRETDKLWVCKNSSEHLYARAYTDQTPFNSWFLAVGLPIFTVYDTGRWSKGPLEIERSYLPSLKAAPPSVTVFTKMPSFSRPMSAPAPIPIILMPRPSPSEREQSLVKHPPIQPPTRVAGWNTHTPSTHTIMGVI